jgi:ParB family chromosome partitioning protein
MSTPPEGPNANSADDQPPAEAATVTDQPVGETATNAQPGAAAIAPQPTIPVALLTAHPGNVRRDLDLSPDFLASIQANGILVPLRITSGADGAFRVIDGHRRRPPRSRRV